MSEHLKFSMAYWHTLAADGTDMFGVGTTDKSFGESDPLALAKKKVYAAFELMDKLGIEYFCFHDRDIAPEGKNLAEFQKNLDCIVPLIKEQMQKYGIKLLWGTANCFASPKYMHGAATSCSAEAFACAAAQVKKAIDITIELGGKGYVFWGGREGYETLLNTDMALEQDNYARFLKMAVLYARAKAMPEISISNPSPKSRLNINTISTLPQCLLSCANTALKRILSSTLKPIMPPLPDIPLSMNCAFAA